MKRSGAWWYVEKANHAGLRPVDPENPERVYAPSFAKEGQLRF